MCPPAIYSRDLENGRLIMKKYTGFTLPELLITLTIVGVMILLAVPSFQHFHRHQQIRYITQALTQSLSYTRLQAVLRAQTVLISPKENDWQKGWVITIDKNKKILRDFPQMPLEIKLISFQKNNNALKILSNGTTDGYQGHFEYGGMSLIFNRAGRTRLEKTQQ